MKISPKQLARVLYELTENKSEKESRSSVADFAAYLHKERKLKLAEKIIEQFGKLYNRQKGVVEAEVVSREKMDETAAKKVKRYVAEKYRADEVVLKNIVDESVKGGFVLRVEDEVTDGSIARRLEELRKILA